jgi:hypothetical protein
MKRTECKIAGEQEKVRVAMFSLIITTHLKSYIHLKETGYIELIELGASTICPRTIAFDNKQFLLKTKSRTVQNPRAISA